MVLGFLDCESNLVRVQGREGKTHLHYVVEQEDVDLLTEFLSACPQSIQDMTIQNETALYIAVKNHKVDALDFLLGGLCRAYHQGSNTQEGKIINWKDDEGNIVLHVATAMNQPQGDCYIQYFIFGRGRGRVIFTGRQIL
nr:ankyrin repeat-containing protein BDA1-like [Ziziphus jujuba var. spinosa]